MLSKLTRARGGYRPIAIAAIAVLLSSPILEAQAKGRWFKPAWHQGPIAADLESELRTLHYATAPGITAAALEA